jgi:hypothetical protein
VSQNPWGWRSARYFDVALPHPDPAVGRVTYPSVTSSQHAALEELGRKIRGAAPQVVGVASIVAFGHGHLELIPAEELALIEAHVAAETNAGRRLPGWLTNNCSNRARIG